MREKGISDPDLAEQLYCERRLSEGTQSYSPFSQYSELPWQYRPQSEISAFDLPVFRVPKNKLEVFLADPDPRLQKKYLHEESISFCVHPASLALKNEADMVAALSLGSESPLSVVPSACSRTVIVLDSKYPLHAIKCHCPFRISRFYRNLGPLTIRHCVALSHFLAQTTLPYLPETIGVAIPSTGQKRGWGFVLREYTPRLLPSGKRKMIPCFALYGKDHLRPDEPPLIVNLIKRFGHSPKEFVLKHIMFPIIEDFVSIFKTQGILLEAHGQNTLLEIDEAFSSTRIVHRDLDNYVDHDFRRNLGLSVEGLKTFEPYFPPGMLSLIYDNSIAHHHFSFLAKAIEVYFNIPEKAFQEACRAKFQEIFPDHADFFPKHTYYYAEDETSRNNYPLIKTKARPSWRPY